MWSGAFRGVGSSCVSPRSLGPRDAPTPGRDLLGLRRNAHCLGAPLRNTRTIQEVCCQRTGGFGIRQLPLRALGRVFRRNGSGSSNGFCGAGREGGSAGGIIWEHRLRSFFSKNVTYRLDVDCDKGGCRWMEGVNHLARATPHKSHQHQPVFSNRISQLPCIKR